MVECEGQRTGVLTIEPAGGELAAAPDLAALLVSEKEPCRLIDMAEVSLTVEDDNCLTKLVEDLEPCSSERTLAF